MTTLRRLLRHFGHQRDGGGAAADHHDALVRVVEVFRPFLRMDDFAREIFGACEFRRVAARIVVIAAAHEKEIAGEARDLSRPALSASTVQRASSDDHDARFT